MRQKATKNDIGDTKTGYQYPKAGYQKWDTSC